MKYCKVSKLRATRLLDLRSDRCVLIAEIAQAHDGSLGTAHAYIDAVASAGADAVKFQTHIAEAESTPGEPWRVRFSPQDETRYDYWKRMEFSESQWKGLRAHADDLGLLFLSSPFSVAAVEMLERVGVAAWKVASGEIRDPLLFERMAATGLPFLISTGMSPWSDIDAAVAAIRKKKLPLCVLQCTSMYPTPPERLGLNVLGELRSRYGSYVGLSDHSGTIHAGLSAAALGAEVIEVHVVFSRGTFGPDVQSSVTIEELRVLAEGVRFLEAVRANPVDKDSMAEDLAEMRGLFTKSVVAAVPLSAGTVLQPEHITTKKPGTGIPGARIAEFYGRRLNRALDQDDFLLLEHLEADAS